MQWVEEADREDPIIPLKKGYKAFNCYTRWTHCESLETRFDFDQ